MKKTLLAALFLAVGAGTVGLKAVTPGALSGMQGSDTLRTLTRDVIAACNVGGTGAPITYIGGGSGAGESQIIQNVGKADGANPDTIFQRVAPMSRFLQGAAGSGVCTSGTQDKAEGIEIAGDAIGVWFNKNLPVGTTNRHAACDPNSGSSAPDNCQGYSVGGLNHTRTLACGITVTTWKDVIRLIYFGLRPSDFNLPTSPADPNTEVSPAAIARRDCQDPCREELRNNYSKLFDNDCGGVVAGKIQRAFRRDENSGTTDFFRETVNVEAGANITNKGFPFCNEFVPGVTNKVASVAVAATGGTCTVGTSTGCPSSGAGGPYVCQSGGTTCKRADNGCAVAADCAAGSVCDLGQQQCIQTCTVNADCTSLGAKARCVPNAVGTTSACFAAVDGCKVDADCDTANGFVCDLNSNGGTCAPTQIFNAAGARVACNNTDCAAYLPGGSCQTVSGQSACVRSFGKVCPVPGLVFGTSSGAGQAGFGGTVAGYPGVARSRIDNFGFENQQDNDLLRSPAAGAFSFAGLTATEPDPNPAEQVASLCGDLGLVLPVSLPPAASVNDPAVFPRTVCARNKFGYAPAQRIASGVSPRYLLCPNGDFPFGATGWDATLHAAIGGTGNCLYPELAGVADKRCLNARNSVPTRVSPQIAISGIQLPTATDGRVYNEHLWAAGTLPATQPYNYNGGSQPWFYPVGEVEVTINERVTGAFYRIHSTRTLQTGAGLCIAGTCASDANCGTGGTCVAGVCTSGSCTTNANCGTAAGVCALPSTCTGASGTNLAGSVCCVQSADTQQIGCLVQASPNSLGFAGLAAREAILQSNATNPADPVAPGARINSAVFGAGMDQPAGPFVGTAREVSPNDGNLSAGIDSCIPGTTTTTLQYPIARNLFFNTVEGFESLTGVAKQSQLELSQCFVGSRALTPAGLTIQQLIANNGFVNLSAYPCCRDFNEVSSCGAAVNNPACGDNAGVGLPTTICTF